MYRQGGKCNLVSVKIGKFRQLNPVYFLYNNKML